MQLSCTICCASWSWKRSCCQYLHTIDFMGCSAQFVFGRALGRCTCGKHSLSQSLWWFSVSIHWYIAGQIDFMRKLMKELTRSQHPDLCQSVRCVCLRMPLNDSSWLVVIRTPSMGIPGAIDAIVHPYCNQELHSSLCSHSFSKYS